MRSRTCLEKSFINISHACLQKCKKHFSFKERGLVKMAEKTIMFGVGEDDSSMTENISEYFKKLRIAFSNIYRYYLSAEYVLVFTDRSLLVDMIPIHGITRNDTQVFYRESKKSFEDMSPQEQIKFRRKIIEEFKWDTKSLYDDDSDTPWGSEW